MSATLIKNARLVNEGSIIETDIRIVGQCIEMIASNISSKPSDTIVDAQRGYIIPGMIDDQVHFATGPYP